MLDITFSLPHTDAILHIAIDLQSGSGMTFDWKKQPASINDVNSFSWRSICKINKI